MCSISSATLSSIVIQPEKMKTGEEGNLFECDKTLITLGLKSVKNVAWLKVQCGISAQDKKVEEIMESSHRVYEGSAVSDAIELEGKEFDYGVSGNDVIASLEEIEKMDIILKMKANEEKKARLSRIQAEEESRDILSKLPFPKRPKGIKTNQEEFMRLLNNFENTREDALELIEVSGMAGDEGNEKAESKKEKINCQQSNKNNLPFVERNILLAKNGRGTLSLTDEEQSRIENLLVDIEDVESKTPKKERETMKAGPENKDFYAVDCTTKSILSQIDQQLEGLKKLKTQNELTALDKKEEIALEEGEGDNSAVERKKGKKKSNRLEEIDKLLTSMTTATDKEVIPLSEKEMENLIRVSMQSLCREKSDSSGEGDGCHSEGIQQVPSQLSREVIAELVSDAKSLMPKFKYRFDVA